jgi:uncharacterized protein YoxC
MASMGTMALAMWLLQESDANGTRRIVFILILLIAVAVACMAIVMIALALKAFKAIKELTATADEFKAKLIPLLDEATGLTKSGRELLEDATPKVKIITENLMKTSDTLVETSRIAKASAQKIEATITDANLRAQRQVARVDGMVTAALTTTAEVVETINHGIRVPAQKIAVMANQAKVIAEGLLAKVKSMAAGSPFGSRKDPYQP